MGGFGPKLPIPGAYRHSPGGGYPQYGPRYGAPHPPEDLVSSRTPAVVKFVQGINEFVGGFRDLRDAEKQRAREQALQNIQMAQMGIPIDQKKTARLMRKGGIDLDMDAVAPQQQPIPTSQQQQAAQQFSAAGMIGGPQAIAGAMAGGQGMPMPSPQGLPGPTFAPQQGGGMPAGGNFLHRFGRTISGPFRDQQLPVPEEQTAVAWLKRLQASGAAQQEVEAAQRQIGLATAKAMQTFVGGEVGSPEWEQATRMLYSLDKIKELPMEVKVRELQRLGGVKDEREAARLIYAAENINLPGGPNPEADRNAMAFVNAFQRSHAGADPSKALLGYRKMLAAKTDGELLSIDWGLSDNKDDRESLQAVRTEFQKLEKEYLKAPRAALWTAATHLLGGDIEAYDKALEPFGPPRSSEEVERQKAREAREQTKFAQGQVEQEADDQVEDFANRLFQEGRGEIGVAVRKLGEYQQDVNAPWQYRAYATRIRERLEDIARGGRSGVDVRVSSVPAGPPGGNELSDADLRRLREGNR